jgi:hypothetical protein
MAVGIEMAATAMSGASGPASGGIASRLASAVLIIGIISRSGVRSRHFYQRSSNDALGLNPEFKKNVRSPPIPAIGVGSHSRGMSNRLSYGPDKALVGFWALLCSPPALIWSYLLLQGPVAGKALPFFLSLVLLLAPVLFASRFRATFSPTEFVYRRWGPTIRVPYSDIERIEVTNATPIARHAVGAVIVTRSGNHLPFWPKLFPREAVERFFALAS